MKSPCFFVEIFAEKRREVCLMRGQDTVSVLKGGGGFADALPQRI